MIIHPETGVIEDISCTLLTDEAKLFLKDVIVGFNVHTQPIEELLDYVSSRFHVMSQKAICVSIRDAYERYHIWKNE